MVSYLSLNGFHVRSVHCLHNVRQDLYNACFVHYITQRILWGRKKVGSRAPSCLGRWASHLPGQLGILPLLLKRAKLLFIRDKYDCSEAQWRIKVFFFVYLCVLRYIATLITHDTIYGCIFSHMPWYITTWTFSYTLWYMVAWAFLHVPWYMVAWAFLFVP